MHSHTSVECSENSLGEYCKLNHFSDQKVNFLKVFKGSEISEKLSEMQLPHHSPGQQLKKIWIEVHQ